MVWMRIGWPAFLAACALELLVFAVVDPQALQWSGHAVEVSRQAVYTLGFFAFWLVVAGACAITALLGQQLPPPDLKRGDAAS
ncbi:MAG: hypothetical protein ABIT82_04490 [Ramlibacter sp.]